MYLTYGVIAAIILLVAMLALKTNLIRDVSLQPSGRKPYSLGRTQLVLWATMIVSCTIYLYGKDDLTRDAEFRPSRTPLILLGIAVCVFVIGRIVDGLDRRRLTAGKVMSLNQDMPTEGFLKDILSDRDGVSIMRFQNVVYSLVMMAGFVHQVVRYEVMPDFPDSILLLSGLSSGGYLASKAIENR